MPGRQPTNWQDATATTIARIQQIFALNPDLGAEDKIRLYQEAQAAVVAMNRATNGGTEYWNTFVNVLRTLVAGMSECDPAETFDR